MHTYICLLFIVKILTFAIFAMFAEHELQCISPYAHSDFWYNIYTKFHSNPCKNEDYKLWWDGKADKTNT